MIVMTTYVKTEFFCLIEDCVVVLIHFISNNTVYTWQGSNGCQEIRLPSIKVSNFHVNACSDKRTG